MADQLPKTLCPIYKDAFREMLASLGSAEKNEEKIEILTKFSDKYLMIPEYWGLLIDLSEQVHGYSVKENLINKGRSHFYSIDDWQQAPTYFIYNFHLKWNYTSYLEMNIDKTEPNQYIELINDLKELLTFPHQNLGFAFGMLESYGPSPPSLEIKQQYEKSKKLYEKFVEAGDDDEKWLECIKEVEVDKAVVDTIELRLGEGQHYANQKIWKYYIKFLKSRNFGGLMNVYDRYCRLFISDRRAKRKYQMLKYVKFPIVCKDYVKIIVNLSVRFWKKEIQRFSSPAIYFKNCTKSANQSMAFRSTLMHYIAENAKAPVLHKLHKTCKYFFIQRPYPVCHRLILSNRAYCPTRPLYYIEQSLFVHLDVFFRASNLQNLYVSYHFLIDSFKNENLQKYLSSKLHKCEACEISFDQANLNLKDYEFFVNSGAVTQKHAHQTKIFKKNGQLMERDEVKEIFASYGNELENFVMCC